VAQSSWIYLAFPASSVRSPADLSARWGSSPAGLRRRAHCRARTVTRTRVCLLDRLAKRAALRIDLPGRRRSRTAWLAADNTKVQQALPPPRARLAPDAQELDRSNRAGILVVRVFHCRASPHWCIDIAPTIRPSRVTRGEHPAPEALMTAEDASVTLPGRMIDGPLFEMDLWNWAPALSAEPY